MHPEDPEPARAGTRFNLRMLLLFTAVVAVATATWGGLTRSGNQTFYLFFAAAAPFGVLALVGLVYQLLRFLRRR